MDNQRYEAFDEEHGYTVTNALQVYVDRMRQEARELREAYATIKADPELAAAQDKTLMTTGGLRMSADLFSEAADKTERALRAWQELTEHDMEGSDL